MKIAETVTFGGSGLDRTAERRGNISKAERAAAKTILFWRGKPLLDESGLVRVASDHPVLNEVSKDRVFLGRDADHLTFAAELTDWVPESGDPDAVNSFLDSSLQHHPAMEAGADFAELRANMTRLSPRDAELAASAKAVQAWHRSHRFCAICGAQSVFAMDGWQRDCPTCGGHHFPRTDPVVIMLITHGNSALLGRSPGWPEGMYSLLAGFVEPGETIEAAVRREVFEEAGISVGPVSYLASQPWPFPASLMFGCAGEAISTEIDIDTDEIEDARWVSREEMTEVFAGQHPDILPARKGAIAHFLLENWLADRLD